MTTLTASRSALRPHTSRDTDLVTIERMDARQHAAASLLETCALSFVLAAVAGVLPLVMYLRG